MMATGSRLTALFAVLVLTTFAPAHARDGLKCKHGLARPGDSTEHVRGLCGEPLHVDSHVEARAYYPDGSYTVLTGQSFLFAQRLDSVKVEEWVYPVGRQKLTCHVQFDDDKLVSVRIASED